MTELANLLAAGSLGAMLFFSAVVATKAFKVLSADNAGKFFRALFPAYFLLNGLIAALAALLCGGGWPAALLLVAAALMIAVWLLAIPVINAARVAMLAGDSAAKRRFGLWHGATVIVNIAEMGLLCAAIILLQGSTR